MNIRDRLLTVSKDIIPSLDLSFQKHLNESLSVTFSENYPENNENLIRIETLIPRVEISGKEFNIWSDAFQKLADKNLSRKYLISLKHTHHFCFSAFCNYFEILSMGQFNYEAQKKFNEYLFYLKIQINHSNKMFTDDYKRYWREFLLRLKDVFEKQATTFSTLFSANLLQSILDNLNNAILYTPPRKF